MSGISSELDQALVHQLANFAAAAAPTTAQLSALEACKAAQLSKAPRSAALMSPTHSKQPKAAVVSTLSLSLEDWRLEYTTSPGAAVTRAAAEAGQPGSRASAAEADVGDNPTVVATQLRCRHRMLLSTVSAELLLPQCRMIAGVADLTVVQQELVHAAGSRSEPPAAAADPASPGANVRLLHVTSITAGIVPAAAAAAGNSGSSEAASPAVDVEVTGVDVRFEPDVAFAAVDTAAEFAAVGAEVKWQLLTEPQPAAEVAAATAAGLQEAKGMANAAAAQRVRQQVGNTEMRAAVDSAVDGYHGGNVAACSMQATAATDSRKKQQPQVTARVRQLQVEVALAEGTAFTLEVCHDAEPVLKSVFDLSSMPAHLQSTVLTTLSNAALCC